MTECESYGRHCLWGPGGGRSVCCGHGGEYEFPDLFEFLPTDTIAHECCFLAIENQPNRPCTGLDVNTEAADGRVCGWGCTNCDDIAFGALGSSNLARYGEVIGGGRWLAPVRGSGRRPWDARGLIHDLRSDEYHPIPGRIVYRRGTCWQNDGLECFGADACACFGANTISPAIDLDSRCDGIYQGDELTGLLPDLFFRTGYRWPPNVPGAPTQSLEQWYCRKFGDTRSSWAPPYEGNVHSMVVVDPSGSGGLVGVTEPMMDPALLSSNVCQSDRLADCMGMFYSPGHESPCYWHSALGACIQALSEPTPDGIDQCKRTYYAPAAARRRFAKLNISGDNTAYIKADEGDRSGLQGSTAAWKNEILAAIRTQEFPLPREEGGAETTIRFDRLDHMAEIDQNNSGIGLFEREWLGRWIPVSPPSWPFGYVPEILGTLVEVPGGSGMGRLRQAGCEFQYRTYITQVKITCRLILQQYHRTNAKYINPLVRLHIIAITTIYISRLYERRKPGTRIGPRHNQRIDFQPCLFTPFSLAQPVHLEQIGRWTAHDGYIPRLSTEESLGDYGESFMFFNADGRQFIPSRVIEWRGFLGGHSKPTSEDQRVALGIHSFGSCEWVADRLNSQTPGGRGIIVPGWPTHVDSYAEGRVDDPAGIYGGHVRLEFL